MSYKRGPGERTITFPLVQGRRVKRVYLDRIIETWGCEAPGHEVGARAVAPSERGRSETS